MSALILKSSIREITTSNDDIITFAVLYISRI